MTTEQKKNVLAIPIQALAVRTRHDIEEANKKAGTQGAVTLAAGRPTADSASDSGGDPDKQDVQGVFVVRNKKAIFVPVETGITGVTDIEVLTGLQQGDQIITGSYKALRTIKPGASVKVDNSAPKVRKRIRVEAHQVSEEPFDACRGPSFGVVSAGPGG